jgi:hypothetical protein
LHLVANQEIAGASSMPEAATSGTVAWQTERALG